MLLYPLLFKPIFEDTGRCPEKLSRFWQHPLPEDVIVAGTHARLLVDTEDGVSGNEVLNGPLAGTPVGEVMAQYAGDLVGTCGEGNERFPLSVRLFELDDRTPLQVQPADQRVPTAHSKFWYILDGGQPLSEVGVGIRARATRMQVTHHLDDEKLRDYVEVYPARTGDSFFIPPGAVHYLSGGTLALQIQHGTEPARVLSHWGRGEVDAGEQKKALDAVHFEKRQAWRIACDTARCSYTRKIPLMHACPELVVDEFRLKDALFEKTDGTSFHLFFCMRGSMSIEKDGEATCLSPGGICCVPAKFGDYAARPAEDEMTADVLRVSMRAEGRKNVLRTA